MPVIQEIWAVEQKTEKGWETVSIPVDKTTADAFINQVGMDISPDDIRPVAYRRIDPETQSKSRVPILAGYIGGETA